MVRLVPLGCVCVARRLFVWLSDEPVLGSPAHRPITPMPENSSSMQLTRAADYGVRVMVHLATLSGETRALLPALAEATGAPESFLSKVLQSLARAGLIGSRRGKSGGFTLLQPGREASLYDVVQAIEGPIRLNVCLTDGNGCGRMESCPAHSVWAEAQKAMLDVLMRASIAEMASAGAPQAAGGGRQGVFSNRPIAGIAQTIV